jgi:hypothetical protein
VKKSQLSDKQLEEILGQMPKVKDHRDSRDIYQNIAHRVERRKKIPTWVIPGAALAAVLFLAFILSPGLMVNHSSDKSIESNSASDAKSSMEMDTATRDDTANESASQEESTVMMDEADGEVAEKSKQFAAMDEANPYDGLISLYPDEADIENSEILTYAVPDNQAMTIVPVSVTVPKEEGKTWINSYTGAMLKLKEKEWGLSEYYPMDATWSYDEATKTLTMDVKPNNPYSQGGTSNVIFVDSMTQNFSGVGIEKMVLATEGKKGIELSNYGPMEELPLNAETKNRRAYLFLTVKGMPNPYLVPTKEQHDSIGKAFEQMWKGDGYLSASLPEDFKLARTEQNEDKVLEIILEKNTKLDESFLPNLEAILMTASEFDYSGVKFTNANIDQLGPFNLNEVLPLPIAPNKKNIN